MLYKTGTLRIVDISGDRAVLDLLHRVVDHEQRHKKPFARDDWVAEPVLDLDVEPGRVEDTMDQVFELAAADVEQLVGCHDLHVRQKEGRVQLGVGNTLGDIAAGDADLVNEVAVGGDNGIVRLATQDIDGATGKVVDFAYGSLNMPRSPRVDFV